MPVSEKMIVQALEQSGGDRNNAIEILFNDIIQTMDRDRRHSSFSQQWIRSQVAAAVGDYLKKHQVER